ncbi:MAG: PEGA domain-containing protein [Myxococcaceae bacterium]|nr:PEGA domain-containing protein [Myxococcaceae bacterium]
MSPSDPRGRGPLTGADEGATWEPSGPELDASGRLTGAQRPASVRADAGADLRRASAPAEEVLEVAEHTPRAARMSAAAEVALAAALAPERRRGGTRRGRGLLVLVGVGVVVAAVVALPEVYARVRSAVGVTGGAASTSQAVLAPTGAAPSGTVMVLSEPSGATVRIAGRVVGTTPLAVDDTWTGEVPVEVTLTGYRVWRGTFSAGEGSLVRAKLRR